jgi:hypothetical protein
MTERNSTSQEARAITDQLIALAGESWNPEHPDRISAISCAVSVVELSSRATLESGNGELSGDDTDRLVASLKQAAQTEMAVLFQNASARNRLDLTISVFKRAQEY